MYRVKAGVALELAVDEERNRVLEDDKPHLAVLNKCDIPHDTISQNLRWRRFSMTRGCPTSYRLCSSECVNPLHMIEGPTVHHDPTLNYSGRTR